MRLIALFAAAFLPLPAATVAILTTDGKTVEGTTGRKKITIQSGGARQEIPLTRVLSIHNGAPASAEERQKIEAGLIAIRGTDRGQRDAAVEQLAAIGIPVITPLLDTYKDTDMHEPNPLYRLFSRIMPAHADQLDRTLSMVRLTGGETIRGELAAEDWMVNGTAVPAGSIRRVAIRQKLVKRSTEVHSLRHSNQIEFMDSGILLSESSAVEATASGFTRLSWNVDGWTSDPDGLRKPGPNYKTNLVNGHPFGALVGRVNAAGQMFVVGSRYKGNAGKGQLYLAVNDNPHWQNNLGSYRLSLMAFDAYDVCDPQ